MSNIPGVTISDNIPGTKPETIPGSTVVVNNKRDGVKKYGIFFGSLVLAAVVEGVRQSWPQYGGFVDLALQGLTYLFPTLGAAFLTSPLDLRGVVLHHNGNVSGTKV